MELIAKWKPLFCCSVDDLSTGLFCNFMISVNDPMRIYY